jgi:hypothetical protein
MSRKSAITEYRGTVSVWNRPGGIEVIEVTSDQRLPKYRENGVRVRAADNDSEEYIINRQEIIEVKRDPDNPHQVKIVFRIGA